jgi:hypothetical protein
VLQIVIEIVLATATPALARREERLTAARARVTETRPPHATEVRATSVRAGSR